ncbi:MAG: hypothetical protein JHC87_02790 [Thermoleophilaceae bacterium]|nr:hypothetical protein [Thermoleophilaceae bacterium]
MSGQSAIEVLSLVPLIALVALLCIQALAAGVAVTSADHAAHAAVVALADGDAAAARLAAWRAIPGWARGRVHTKVSGDEVRVTLWPRVIFPGLQSLLETRAVARLSTRRAG